MGTLRPTRHGFAHQPALDGLRAIAVAVVVLYHLDYYWFSGGYLGVDTFFVLSGYLITSLIINEQQRNGTINVRAFWVRRFKRLLPAAILLILGVAAYAEFVASSDQFATLRGDSLATLGYVANWRLILANASYFELWSEASPLRHMWSLAIEEQFYVLWPLLMLMLVGRRNGKLGLLLGFCVAGSVASVAAMAYLAEHSDRSRAYYGTDARVHTILIGAALAVILHRRPPTTANALRAVHVAGAFGAVVMGVAFVRLGDNEAIFYYGASPVFALAVTAVIASGVSGDNSPIRRVLHHRPLRWLGDVSYGIYLWHWPMITWLTPSRLGLEGIPLDVVRVGASLGLATLSYYLVERPIRHGTSSNRRTVLVAAIAIIATAAIVIGATRGATSSDMEPTLDGDITVFTPDTTTSVPNSVSTSVPTSLVPDDPGDDLPQPTEESQGVLLTPQTVGLVGDSVADTLAAAFGEAYANDGVTFASVATSGCGVAAGRVTDDNHELIDWADICIEAAVIMQGRLVAEHDPDLVIWHSTWETGNRLEDGVSLTFGTELHDQALMANIEQALNRITVNGSVVVIVLPPPRAISDYEERPDGGPMAHLAEIYRSVADQRDDVQVLDITPIVCPDGPPCAREVDGMVIRPDGGHYSEESAPWLIEKVLPVIRDLRWPAEVVPRR